MKRSMSFGNDSTAGTNTTVGDRGSTVKGPKGMVQRAALKKITGAAAVGAVVDAADESQWPYTQKKGLHPNKPKHTVKHVVPTADRPIK